MPYALDRPRLWYERRGRGEPLLLITGFAISAAVFEPVVGLYADDFDCILYDNRGAGRSGAPRWPTSMPQLAGDAVHLLDALGLDSVHVYGVSMGGMIAQELAIRFPQRVRGLVLGATTPGGPRAARPAFGEVVSLLGDTTRAVRNPGRPWLGAMLFSPEFRREQPDRVLELLEYFHRHRASLRGFAAHWWASVYHDTVSRLNRIQAPTLVMHGEHDAMAPPANARLLAERIPRAELAVVPRAGHAYALERPRESLALTLEWFRAHEPIRPGRAPTGAAARAEPISRALGLPLGALRTGTSLLGRAREGRRPRTEPTTPPTDGDSDVAVDRRAA